MSKHLMNALLVLTLAGPALAQTNADHSAHHASAPAAADLSEGEVKKIDLAQAKITLKHGEIKNLDMPPMTMVFGVADKALLDGLKVGDKVRFKVVQQSGRYVVTELQR